MGVSLLSDIASSPRKQAGSRCKVSLVLATLDEADSRDLRVALTDQSTPGQYTYSAEQIRDTLAGREIEIGYSTINRHRRGGCKCR